MFRKRTARENTPPDFYEINLTTLRSKNKMHKEILRQITEQAGSLICSRTFECLCMCMNVY